MKHDTAILAAEDWERTLDGLPPEEQPVEPSDAYLGAWRSSRESQAARDIEDWRLSGWPPEVLQPQQQMDEGPVLFAIHRFFDAAIDHARALCLLLNDPGTSRAPLVLARVILDASAHAAYLLQTPVEPTERLIRTLNETLARAGEDFNAARRQADSGGMDKAELEISAIFSAVETRSQTKWKRDGRSLPVIGERVSTARMTTQLLKGSSNWNVLSGVVHSKEDEGLRLLLGHSPGLENPHRDSYIALHCFGAVIGVTTFAQQLNSYTGWNLKPAIDGTNFILSVWADGCGLNDAKHRAAEIAARVHSI
ncbi:MAG: hypothetical protein Q7L55_02615 [Actinomycetota bacterium]|nr:hypothetical protein [Actinomycetota bacterium]